MKIIKGNLILKENTIFNEDLKVEGNIICEGGLWNIEAGNIKAGNIKARNIEAGNIEAGNIKAWDIEYWAVCYARMSFKCKSVKGRRKKSKHFCLDKEIELK